MDPKLQQTLSSYLDSLLAAMKDGAAFAKDQIPLVVQEKLTYDFYSSVVWLVIGLLVLVGGLMLGRLINRNTRNTPNHGVGYALGGLPVLVGFAVALENVLTMIKIHTAPRLYIIEWLVNSVR